MKRLLKYILKFKFLFIYICLFSLISALCTIIAPVFVGNIIDEMLVNNDKLFINLIILFSIYLLLFISNLLLNSSLTKLTTKVSHSIRIDLFNKLNKLTIAYTDKERYGDIVNRFTVDVDNLSNGIISSFSKITIGIVTTIVSIIIMLKINPIMAVILILVAPIMYIISNFIKKGTKRLFVKKAYKLSELNGYTEEIISGQKTFKDFAYENSAMKKFKSINNDLYYIGLKSQFYSSLTNPTTRFISNLAYIFVGILGILMAQASKITIGNISTFLMYTNIFTRPFNEITAAIAEIQTSLASSSRIFEFLDAENEVDTAKALPITSLNGYIEFKDVDFSYSEDTPFIQNFNLTVNKGETIAIVGKTGSGKTTIVNLLMRFYEINKGKILIDGMNLQDIPKDFLRKNIGIVLQDTKLFTGTIRENIAYGKEDATDEEIKRAAILANADSFIKRLPDGYNTYISSDEMLSAGEIQLINIARVMLLNPPILILDEATSNIDLITENKIQKAFEKLINNSTSFIIAHRLWSIKNADRILFVENGNIVEQGTHEELLAKRGKYFNLYNSQFVNNI